MCGLGSSNFFLRVTSISRLLQINATIGVVVMSQASYVSLGCVCRGALLADFRGLKGETWFGMAGPTRSSDKHVWTPCVHDLHTCATP